MKIAFDFNAVVTNRFSGFYSFGTGLLKGFNALAEKPEFLLFHSARFSKESTEAIKGINSWAKLRCTYFKMRWIETFWQYSNYPKLESFTGPFDIYHSFHHLMPPTQNKPRILTIHDLRRYRLPHLYKESKLKLFEKSVKLADHFIAVSEATKNDLCYFFNVPPEKVDVVHLAADENLMRFSAEEKDAVRKRISLKIGLELQKYVIAFSSSDKRKNITRIAKAFLAAKSKMPTEYKLLIIGSLPKDDKTFLELLEKDGGKNIIAAGHVNDITEFLGGADAMVFASLYEGFGIPILEAFATGVPVITSNCSSMPEVADKAAILVDPLSEACIAEAIQQVCNNSVLKENMIVQGTQKLQQFSWTKTAEATFKVYKKLC